MDAQVAYGFHHLRDEAPWLASGPIANQVLEMSQLFYSITSGFKFE
jgi:diacylglycerol kinase (ATP)